MSQKHIINKTIFDIAYNNEQEANQLQNKISNISNTTLSNTIKNVLDKYGDEALTIRLNTLVLDIGEVSEQNLETEIIEKVEAELESVLKKKLKTLRSTNSSIDEGIVTNTFKQLELLEWYLVKGILPWWAKGNNTFNINLTINLLVKDSLNELTNMINKNSQTTHFIKRVVYNFEDRSIYKLIRKLSPAEAQLLINTGENTIAVQEKNQIIKTDRQTFHDKTWEFILVYILNDRGSVFNTKTFVKSLLLQLSAFFNVSFFIFLKEFHHSITQIKFQKQVPNGLAEIINEIYNQEHQSNYTKEVAPLELKNNLEFEKKWLLKQLKSNQFIQNEGDLKKAEAILEKLLSSQDLDLLKWLDKKQYRGAWDILKKHEITGGIFEKIDKIKAQQKVNQTFKKNKTEALFYYLEKGTLPLKYAYLTIDSLPKVIASLIKIKPNKIRGFLLKKGHLSATRINLIKALDEHNLQQIIKIIEPTGALVIIRFAENLQNLKHENKISTNTTNAEFNTSKWSFILEALLVDRGSQFNLKSFVKSSLYKLAAHFNIAYEQLISIVLYGLKTSQSNSQTGNLSTALLDLQKEEIVISKKRKNKSQQNYIDSIKLDWVQFIIKELDEPWWGQAHNLKLTDFQDLFISTSKAFPKDIKKAFLINFKSVENRRYILSKLSRKGIIQIIRTIQPTSVEAIEFYSSVLDKLHQQQEQASTQSNFNQYKWDIIIFKLVDYNDSSLNLKSFIMGTLHQMANHFNTSFHDLFTGLIALTENLTQIKNASFYKALADLKLENSTRHGEIKQLKTIQKSEAENSWKTIMSNINTSLKPLYLHLYESNKNILWTYTQKQDLMLCLKKLKPSSTNLKLLFKKIGFTDSQFLMFFQQFSVQEQKVWLSHLIEDDTLFINYYNLDFKQIFHGINVSSQTKFLAVIQTFSIQYITTENSPDKHNYFASLIKYVLNHWHLSWAEVSSQLTQNLSAFKSEYKSTLPLSVLKLQANLKKANQLETKTEETTQKTIEEIEPLKTIKPSEPVPYKTEEKESYSGEKTLITNAGLVILWPFLTQYFEMLNLLNSKMFKDNESAIRAVHLLQFLMTGHENHPEHELYLNKIICGVPTSTPVQQNMSLTDQEKEVSNSLLDGVIKNWPSVNGTSIDGIRETFFRREALLTYTEDAIELNVERKTVDILLDGLPWSFSIVKLPWMKKMIQVIWQ